MKTGGIAKIGMVLNNEETVIVDNGGLESEVRVDLKQKKSCGLKAFVLTSKRTTSRSRSQISAATIASRLSSSQMILEKALRLDYLSCSLGP